MALPPELPSSYRSEEVGPKEDPVLHHALQHLSYLHLHDEHVRAITERGWVQGLSGFTPAPFYGDEQFARAAPSSPLGELSVVAAPIRVELLPVVLRDGEVHRVAGAGRSAFRARLDAGADPQRAVRAMLEALSARAGAVWSTSWRIVEGELVLTFLAVLDRAPDGAEPIELCAVVPSALAKDSATEPHPDIADAAVVTHALRTAAEFAQRGAARLDEGWRLALAPFSASEE